MRVSLAHDVIGQGPTTVLMLMGIGAPRLLWPLPLLECIADAGYRVVRCDNRDCGDSPKVDAPAPSPMRSILGSVVGLPSPAPYSLSDMAGDAVGLLDELGVERAHVVGASMGGMIAQTLAVEHPDRVQSLTSMMSSTGARRLGMPGIKALRTITRQRSASSPEEQRERLLELTTVLGSGRFAPDVERIDYVASASWEQSTSSEALHRQLAAVLAMGRRTPSLRRIQAPTLVLHGAQDPLFPPRFARAQARAIPGAQLHFVDGMGHDMPAPLWPEIAGRIVRHLREAEA
ncbi:MAG: alpha/beta hydrolase [Deltaproteobacteria bacterium]|nr:MAG: alpha/beta hydrolase [Deltaproteobacteria bacterium]